MPDKSPEPDQFGRYRVKTDTGAHISINRPPLESEQVLKQPASDVAGDALPPTYPGDDKAPAESITVPPLAADTKES